MNKRKGLEEIVIPVFYSVDDSNNDIIDEEEIRDEFEYQLSERLKNLKQRKKN